MENVMVELSKYIVITLMTIYTFFGFFVFQKKERKGQEKIYWIQRILIFSIHFIFSFLLYMDTKSMKVIGFYSYQVVFLVLTIILYQFVYRNLSKLVLNHMLMLLSISFIMLTRLNFDLAKKQFYIATASMVICLFIPFVIEKFKMLSRLGIAYGITGIGILILVLVFGKTIYGATNWLELFGIMIQPSEFVKILFVFFAASMLSKCSRFRQIVFITILAALHVLILVLEKDLGAALIFFVTYIFMLYIATSNAVYLFSGLISGVIAAVTAYQLFDHVKIRVQAWSDPWSDIASGGYQIAQSLFAIGTGGWFGMGLGKGLPNSIPVVESDFIFSAVSEEMGGIFALCIILIYMSCFLTFLIISMKMKNMFYKLTALGFSVLYIFQVFLSIGGVTKLIPSTGVTLPMMSYGGSSIASMMLIFSILQGLYILNQNEDEKVGKRKKIITSGQRTRDSKAQGN
ncbi:cell division protein FtsW, lipid II flippase [Anaeromicropila populeti]|uniref:Cell division protein FtsW, lipid II flippase n=1 Tax=Anaeromicropila populeti TaxID=37658 RepID=A0A1I6K6M8_9FIRM|nr:cell division protein FtsW, lipid II flippase [Anaeromicropila populeti]